MEHSVRQEMVYIEAPDRYHSLHSIFYLSDLELIDPFSL
ncbi:MAG: hypothetical protein K0R55_969 [Sporomusa sp.]|nr:hypothetical protein [Sporomusa sp.]